VFLSQLGLRRRVQALEIAVQELGESLEQLRGAHERLRGRFYATKHQDEPPPSDSKADVLKRFGFVPGRPAPHKD
jgi:hypothetical protein